MFGQIAPMPKKELAQLTADIKQNGIKVPILINRKKDTILDGHTRWKIAYDLKLELADDQFEVFEGEDAEIEREILSRNLYRRHLTDDQRIAILSKLRGPQLEKEARERQQATQLAGKTGGKFAKKAIGDDENIVADTSQVKGSVAAKLAKEAGTSEHKARQAEKARKGGGLDDVLAGKEKLHKAAAKAPAKTRTSKKEVPFEDQVYSRWTRFVNHYPPADRRTVMELAVAWVGENKAGVSEKDKSKHVRYSLVCSWLSNDGVKPKSVIDDKGVEVSIHKLIFGMNGDEA